jgi:hypothetical protein
MNMSYKDSLTTAKQIVTITPSPLILERPGDTFRGAYLGLRNFEKVDIATGEIRQIPVAHFYDGTKVVFNMGTQLTRVVQPLPLGISVEITLQELKPNSKGGKTKIYAVSPLDIPKLNLDEEFGGFLQITAPQPEHLLPPPVEVVPEQEPRTREQALDDLYA